MPIIIPDDYWQVTLNWRGDIFESGVGATVFGISYDGANPPNTIAALIGGAAVDALMADAADELTLSTVTVISATLGGEAIVEEQGGGTYDLPPPNVAALVRKVTIGRGRRAQGRMFLPGMVGETAIDALGNIGSSAFTSLQANLTEFYDALVALEMQPVILHNSEGETPPGAPTTVSGFVLQAKVATQRRRLR